MTFFKGQEQYSIDAKGRVNIPAKMRKSISPEANDTFAITRGVDKCIEVYPLDEWKKYEEKFRSMNQYDERKRYFLRTILRWTEEVSLDSQQRITIPKKLLGFAGIEKQAVIVGMGDHIEFWNPEVFEKYLDEHDESYEDVAAEVMTI
jgi:MraZ protein|tara:strand:+ start:183 stop:626 length:444 start_codon:yes stop_codon:yes gene_type:complete